MEDPEDIRPPTSCFKTALISMMIVLSCPLVILILAWIAPYVNQYDYVYVGENFAEALMLNNGQLARRLAVPSQWNRIDAWMSTHEAFRCPFSWDFDDYQTYTTGRMGEVGSRVSFFHSCWVDEYYDFEIEEIILQRQEDRWQVVDWSEVLETK